MKPSQTRAQKWTRVIYTLVLLSFILPVGYLIYRLIFWDEAAAQALERTRADYALMLLQCLAIFFKDIAVIRGKELT